MRYKILEWLNQNDQAVLLFGGALLIFSIAAWGSDRWWEWKEGRERAKRIARVLEFEERRSHGPKDD